MRTTDVRRHKRRHPTKPYKEVKVRDHQRRLSEFQGPTSSPGERPRSKKESMNETGPFKEGDYVNVENEYDDDIEGTINTIFADGTMSIYNKREDELYDYDPEDEDQNIKKAKQPGEIPIAEHLEIHGSGDDHTVEVYRAANTSDHGKGTCWAERKEDAEEYLDFPGFGGHNLYKATLTLGRGELLDVTNIKNSEWLDVVEGAGYDVREYPGQIMSRTGRNYPYAAWEEDKEIKKELARRGYTVVKYVDDYPQHCITYQILKDLERVD